MPRKIQGERAFSLLSWVSYRNSSLNICQNGWKMEYLRIESTISD
jgi:hypothetical protein